MHEWISWYPQTWSLGGAHVFYNPELEYYSGDDEKVVEQHIEDMDYARRAILKKARYGVLKSHYIVLSPRRYIKEGPFYLTAKYTYSFFRGLIRGPMKEKKVEYEWAKYD